MKPNLEMAEGIEQLAAKLSAVAASLGNLADSPIHSELRKLVDNAMIFCAAAAGDLQAVAAKMRPDPDVK